MSQVLKEIAPAYESADLLAGPEGLDDVGAVRLGDGKVGLFTTDFFPPVLDDPWSYGAIATANALSDIWASGGEPKVVLNIAAFPADWGDATLKPLFRGAVDKVRESGAVWVGGHTMKASEPLFGFAVYGECKEEELITNNGARPGDRLYLTKPLGTGSLTTAVVRGVGEALHIETAMEGMAALNQTAGSAMRKVGIRAATDITGFGLMGHANHIAQASKLRLEFRSIALPMYEGAAALSAKGVFSGASAKSRETLAPFVDYAEALPSWLINICFDAETSGGVLACVPEEKSADFESFFPAEQKPAWVGEVKTGEAKVALI